MSAAALRIRRAATAEDVADAARLFRAYAASIGVDLSYQGFDAELAGLPGQYAPPHGALLLAWPDPPEDADTATGCVALRPLPVEGCCEMKRLYVAPDGRGLGLGRALVAAVVAAAEDAGYREIRLDTLPTMTDAMALYARMGFVDIPAYYETPVAGTRFMARRLRD